MEKKWKPHFLDCVHLRTPTLRTDPKPWTLKPTKRRFGIHFWLSLPAFLWWFVQFWFFFIIHCFSQRHPLDYEGSAGVRWGDPCPNAQAQPHQSWVSRAHLCPAKSMFNFGYFIIIVLINDERLIGCRWATTSASGHGWPWRTRTQPKCCSPNSGNGSLWVFFFFCFFLLCWWIR